MMVSHGHQQVAHCRFLQRRLSQAPALRCEARVFDPGSAPAGPGLAVRKAPHISKVGSAYKCTICKNIDLYVFAYFLHFFAYFICIFMHIRAYFDCILMHIFAYFFKLHIFLYFCLNCPYFCIILHIFFAYLYIFCVAAAGSLWSPPHTNPLHPTPPLPRAARPTHTRW